MQFQQALVQRPARAQGLGRVEMRGGQHQVKVAHLVHQQGQVAADQGGQFPTRSLAQGRPFRRQAAGQFQGHHATHHAELSHGRHSAAAPGSGGWCKR